ncbi:MAG: serine protease [Beijerinckiaceae bacterium]|nr:serine protease [Beijerinckiaceae bacterium]
MISFARTSMMTCLIASSLMAGAARAETAADSLNLAPSTGMAPAARPLTLPPSDDVVVPAMTSERMRALLAKQLHFPLKDAGTNLRASAKDSAEKIVGGTKAAPGAYPFQVALLRVRRNQDGSFTPVAQFCGGTLVTGRWVLTAAHCLAQGDKGKISSITSPRDIAIMVGSTNLLGKADRILVRRVVTHPRYVPGTSVNDIALLELERAPLSDSGAEKVTVVTRDTEAETLPVNAELTIIGWGMTEAKRSSMDLLETTVSAVDRNACNRVLTTARLEAGDLDKALSDLSFVFNLSQTSRKSLEQSIIQYGGTVTPQMICAGASVDGRDTCPGDSGGPILRRLPNGKIVQVGIVSFGIGQCGVAALPGVYTRLALYTDWMREVVATTGAPTDQTAQKTGAQGQKRQ